jgi:hypothetical protein
MVGDESILVRQLGILRSLTPRILILASDEDRYREAGVPVVRDRIRGAGSLGGIYTVLDGLELGPDELAALDPDGRLLLNVNTPMTTRAQPLERVLHRKRKSQTANLNR